MEEEEVTGTEAASAGAKVLGYVVLIIVVILLGTAVLGAVITPLGLHG